MEYVDRYDGFRTNDGTVMIPNIPIPVMLTDKTKVYELGKTKLFNVSQEYYGNPYSGWLILLANPEFGGFEYSIPDNTVLRIPFPFKTAIENYKIAVNNYILYNGR